MTKLSQPRAPIFFLDFGPEHYVEIHRSPMTKVPGPIGIVEWFALGKFAWQAQTTRTLVSALAANTLDNETRENRIFVGFFDFIVQSRQKIMGY